jgi:hypothetical protein
MADRSCSYWVVVLFDRSRLSAGLEWMDDLIGRSECAFSGFVVLEIE